MITFKMTTGSLTYHLWQVRSVLPILCLKTGWEYDLI